MNDHIRSAKMLDFPPCSSIDQIECAEWFIFALLPTLTKFVRETTAFERAVGINYNHAFVTKTEGGITRLYGSAILLN